LGGLACDALVLFVERHGGGGEHRDRATQAYRAAYAMFHGNGLTFNAEKIARKLREFAPDAQG
jgi:hypothetical protein